MKRLYHTVAVRPHQAGFAVQLDDTPLQTPALRGFILPNAGLAAAVAAEWQAQEKTIIPSTMPLTQLAATALDQVPENRESISQRLLAYAQTDVLCHRVAEPVALARRQHKMWQPPLDWLAAHYGITLTPTTHLLATPPDPATTARLTAILAGCSDWQLIGLQTAALAAGSVVLALALQAGAFTPLEVFAAAELESLHQAELWGEDPAEAARCEAIKAELVQVARWFALL